MTNSSQHPSTIVSLAPSATFTLREMDALDRLIGVTADTPFPSIRSVGKWRDPDHDTIRDLDPDLVLTSGTSQKDIRDTLRSDGYTVSHTDPQTLQQVIDSFIHIGDAVGRREAAETVAWEFQTQVSHIHRRVKPENRPVVYCEPWCDSSYSVGGWIPDAIRIAGGTYPFVDADGTPQRLSPEMLADQSPDHIFIHMQGYGRDRSPETTSSRAWMNSNSTLHILDDSAIHHPSPDLITAINQFTQVLHPEIFLG